MIGPKLKFADILPGLRRGALTVIGYPSVRYGTVKSRTLCRCDCGNSRNALTDALISASANGGMLSCGCQRRNPHVKCATPDASSCDHAIAHELSAMQSAGSNRGSRPFLPWEIEGIRQRLLNRVSPEPNSGCWLWTGYCATNGYGKFGIRYPWNEWAHRASFLLLAGAIPTGLVLDHLCRVRCCVNPAHLEPVTFDENVRRGEAGLNSGGSAHGKAKVNEEQVSVIRGLLTEGVTATDIAARFGISRNSVYCIKSGRTWRDVA